MFDVTGFSQKPRMFLPPFKGSAGLKVLPSKIDSPYSSKNGETEIETQVGSTCPSRSDGLWGGEVFKDYSHTACRSVRGGDQTLQDSGHAAIIGRCLSLDHTRGPPLRRRQVSDFCQDDIYLIVNSGVCVHSFQTVQNAKKFKAIKSWSSRIFSLWWWMWNIV